jgi:hypothetical protein
MPKTSSTAAKVRLTRPAPKQLTRRDIQLRNKLESNIIVLNILMYSEREEELQGLQLAVTRINILNVECK